MTILHSRKQADLDFAIEAARNRRRLRMEYIRAKRSRVHHDSSSDYTETSLERKDLNEIDSKKELRKIRNRESAEASRRRKRNDVLSLQQEVESLMSQVQSLKSRLGKYESLESIERLLRGQSTINQASPFSHTNDTLVYTEPAEFKHHKSLRGFAPIAKLTSLL
jgi:hypothetical protein